MKKDNKFFKYQIIFPPGASGHFLKNFLNTNFRNIEVSNWAQDFVTIEDSYIICGHRKKSNVQYSIVILPSNNDELIKILINRYLKSNRIYQTSEFNINSIDFLTKIFISISADLTTKNIEYAQNFYTSNEVLEGQVNLYSGDFDFYVYYNQIFSIDYLKNLYYEINGVFADNFKLDFAKDYIKYHKNFYQTTYYKVLHQILKFEYENDLFDKTRTWSIDSFDLNDVKGCDENLKKFLKKENYY
jgi:hypothetical protein